MSADNTYTPQMKAATIAMLDHKCRVAGMPTYTTLRETLRVVQENANTLTQQIYGMAVGGGVKPEIAQIALDAWNIDHAEVMNRIKDAAP